MMSMLGLLKLVQHLAGYVEVFGTEAESDECFKPPVVYSTDRSKAVVMVLVALWLVLQGDLFYVLPSAILFLCFSVLLALRLPRLGKRELILVLFVSLFDLCLLGFVGFLFLVVSGKGCVCDCGISWAFLLLFFIQIGGAANTIIRMRNLDRF